MTSKMEGRKDNRKGRHKFGT